MMLLSSSSYYYYYIVVCCVSPCSSSSFSFCTLHPAPRLHACTYVPAIVRKHRCSDIQDAHAEEE